MILLLDEGGKTFRDISGGWQPEEHAGNWARTAGRSANE
jgi:hypothetical protein